VRAAHCVGSYHVAVAAAAFIAIFFFAAPFPLIIAGAALLGFLLPRVPPAAAAAPLKEPPVLLSRTLQTAALWLAIWIVPIVLLAAILGRTHVTTDVALFFSKLAIVTFGGAYSVLASWRNRPLRLIAG